MKKFKDHFPHNLAALYQTFLKIILNSYSKDYHCVNYVIETNFGRQL